MLNFSYNQKEVLFKVIRSHIKRNRAKSLLDIGAGDGTLATRLAKLLPVYVAVEKDKSRARKLRSAGISTIEGAFPIKVDGQFDIVLISHALPEQKKSCKKFLEEAWKKVKKNGVLLIITFKGGDIRRLNKSLFKRGGVTDQAIYQEVITTLKRLGKVKIEKAISTIKSNNRDEIIKVLSLLLKVDLPRGKKYHDQLKQVIETQFKNTKGYHIPTEHLVITVKN